MFLRHRLEGSIPPRGEPTLQDLLNRINGMWLIDGDEQHQDAIEYEMKIELSAPKKVQPANTQRRATIIVSRPVCASG